MAEYETLAAIDLGSNSFHCQVARVVGDQFYPLDNLRLAPGERTGTSNEAVDGPFRIEPESRARPWLLILDRKYLFGVAAAAAAMA